MQVCASCASCVQLWKLCMFVHVRWDGVGAGADDQCIGAWGIMEHFKVPCGVYMHRIAEIWALNGIRALSWGWESGFETEINASRLVFGPQGCYLSLDTSIRALRLEFGPHGLRVCIWASGFGSGKLWCPNRLVFLSRLREGTHVRLLFPYPVLLILHWLVFL